MKRGYRCRQQTCRQSDVEFREAIGDKFLAIFKHASEPL